MALFVVHLIMTVLCQAVFFIVTATEGAAEQAAAPAGRTIYSYVTKIK